MAFNNFVRIELAESEGGLVGKGMLGGREIIEVEGKVNENQIRGTIANITYGINSTFSGIATNNQITADFSGAGLKGRLSGTVILLR